MQKVSNTPTKSTQSERVIAYIDGFNLYFGLKSTNLRKFYWLNLQRLSASLLKAHQSLLRTKYFTSRTSLPPDKERRQSLFIDALSTLADVDMFFGVYQMDDYHCKACSHRFKIPGEKMTDVNIAVEMVSDAFEDKFDTALLISADGDLVAPVKKVRSLHKRVIVAFPPGRRSYKLEQVATATMTIGRANLQKSKFPQVVTKANGYELHCPPTWV